MAVRMRVDAGVTENIESASEFIEQAIESKVDPPELIALGKRIVENGYDLACEFVEILRQDFDQYWLPMPDTFHFQYPSYYSASRQNLYTLVLKGVVTNALAERSRDIYWHVPQDNYVPKIINSSDVPALNAAEVSGQWTFADEMISTALIELHQGRVRSAVLHSVIAYESAAKRCPLINQHHAITSNRR